MSKSKRKSKDAKQKASLIAPKFVFRMPVGPIAIGLLAFVGTLATLVPELGGPGVTCDEAYHVAYGKRLVIALRQQGLDFFTSTNIERNFPWRVEGPPVHPPLGNWILGGMHHLFDFAPNNQNVISIGAARLAPACAFGLLVLTVGLSSRRRNGPVSGTAAAAAVLLVPRMFAHAHFAALDMISTLFFVVAVLAVIEADQRHGGWKSFATAGLIAGLAMLVRLHGLLLIPPVGVWLIWRRRRQAVVPLIAWSGAGFATFFVGWPWLWLAPIEHLRQFLGSAVGRHPIHLFYFGRVWVDHDVPWHYPIVMFLVAVPLGLLLLGLIGTWIGLRRSNRDPGLMLCLGTICFILGLFAYPTTPVYDGARLFLMVFPLGAIAVGVASRWVVEHPAWKKTSDRTRYTMLGSFLLLQAVGLILYHPCQSSHYSLLVGGLRGASRLGFEVNYWGDVVDETLLAEAARRVPGERLLIVPSLAPFQLAGIQITSPSLAENNVFLIGWDSTWNTPPNTPPTDCRLAIVYHRRADLAQAPESVRSSEVLIETSKQGVWLARLVAIHQGRRTGPSG